MSSLTIKQKDDKNIGFIQKYAIQYYLPSLIYIMGALSFAYTQRICYNIVLISLVPLLGKFLPKDDYKVTNAKFHNKHNYHVYPLVSCVMTNMIMVAVICIYFPHNLQNSFSTAEIVLGYVFLVFSSSPSIDAAHQLIHRPQNYFKILGFLNMTIYLFNAYPIEHLYLHHKYVGSDKDPITSKKNRSYYTYVIYAYFSAYKCLFDYSKKMFVGCVSLTILYLSAIYFYTFKTTLSHQYAFETLKFFIIYGLLGYAFLELTQYIEHYGLIYRSDKDKIEVLQASSWNTDSDMAINWFIFRYQRHSDHHMNAYKIFTTMELNQKMPMFPFTFFQGLFIGLISPLWYYIMNPYVDEVLEGKKVSDSHKKLTAIAKYIAFGLIMTPASICFYLVQ